MSPFRFISVTAHTITNFRCKYLATMAMGDDDNDNKDGVMTTTTTTMATARRETGYNDDDGGRRQQRGRWQRRDGRR